MRLLLVALLASACTKTATKQCGDFTCGEQSVCSPNGERCVMESQIDACRGVEPGKTCSFPGTSAGVCSDDVCIASGCGNGVPEPMSGEICDDGNRIDGDMCSADCKSLEACGDGVTDFGRGETCDCGATAATKPMICNGANSMARDATCRTDCKLARCGDGVEDTGEACDDGNNAAGDGCNATCTGRWTRMVSSTLALLRDVSAISTTEAYAVGGHRVLHWDGTSWEPLLVPMMAKDHTFTRVYARAANDVFVIGTRPPVIPSLPPPTDTDVFRIQGGIWTNVTPSNNAQATTWFEVAGNGTNVWLVGYAYGGSSQRTRVARLSNAAFINDGSPGMFDVVFTSLSVAGNGTVWLAEQAGLNANLLTYQNSTWTNPSQASGNFVATTSGTDVFLFTANQGGAHDPDGAVHIPGANAFTPIPDSTELGGVNDIAALPNYVMAVGNNGAVMICETDTPPGTCSASATGVNDTLYGVSVLDKDHAFVVGSGGTILY